MAFSATCEKCGKRLNAKDEWAGKKLKCPGCGESFIARPGGGASAGKAAPAGGKSPGRPAPTLSRPVEPKFAINWGKVSIWGVLALIPIGIILFLVGPMRVKKQWETIHPDADRNATLVMEKALRAFASQVGDWNPNKVRSKAPEINEVIFYPPVFAMSMPAEVKFVGTSTYATFEGMYRVADGEVKGVATTGVISLGGMTFSEKGIDLGGGMKVDAAGPMPKNLPGITRGKKATLNITGRYVGDHAVAEIDGKVMEIYTPPVDPNDGDN